MASDNTTLNSGAGGDVVRDINRNGVKTQVVQLDVGGQSVESLVSPSNPLIVQTAYDTPAGAGVVQLLTEIRGLLMIIANYTYEQPGMIATAINNPYSTNPRGSSEEPIALLGDFLDPSLPN